MKRQITPKKMTARDNNPADAAPLWQWSASELASAIRDRSVSSREVVDAHLDRIAAVNAEVNAVTAVLADEARRAAAQADARIAAGGPVGPLHGVPITVKENFDVIGPATTLGVRSCADWQPEHDAPVIQFLKEAGAIPIGRTNIPDFGLRWHTDNDLHGPTLNPWNPATTPGGSSGGEAAAIATGMSPLGIGNDMGGSIRFPAYCCAIAGLRPSYGRVSRTCTHMFEGAPLFYEQTAAVNGPMARRVADLRLALGVMSARDPADPCWTPAPAPDALPKTPICVAVTRDPVGDGVSPTVAEGVEKAAEILSAAGYEVVEASPPGIEESGEVIQDICDFEIASYIEDMRPLVSNDAATAFDAIIGSRIHDPETYMRAIGTRHRIAKEWSLFLDRYPLVLGPVSTFEPMDVGFDLVGHDDLKPFVRSIALTELCNLIGLPSVAVPVPISGAQPTGVQLIAGRFREDLCLDAAETIERHSGVPTPIDPEIQAPDR